MPATYVESLTNPRDSLPNVYTNVTAREQDFVSVYDTDWKALSTIMRIMRPIRKAPGTALVSYSASVSLEDGDVGPGEVIPYSKSTVVKSGFADLTIKKYAKAVPIEDVEKYGAAIAIQKTDEAFRNQLMSNVLSDFYTFLNTGSLTGAETTWQMALAMAKGKVLDKFNKMRKTVTEVVGFANILDAYEYIGAANITVQTQFGVNYIENFVGYSTLFLLSEPDIARGTVVAVPVENIDLYYIDPGDSEFTRLGLSYTTIRDVPGTGTDADALIGFHAEGNYSTAVGEVFALQGMKLWAEYLDGIAVIDVGYESFTAYSSSTTGKNPAAEKWYEQATDGTYFRTTDETPDVGKTYYTRTVSATDPTA